MHITIDVNVNGLEGLVSILSQFISAKPEAATMAPAPSVGPLAPVPDPVPPFVSQAPVPAPSQAAPMPVQAPTPMPQAQAQAPAQAPIMGSAVPVAAQTYSMDQLAVAATQLMDNGRQPDLIALLTSFGVQALTQLPKERYGEFATCLRSMGAKI